MHITGLCSYGTPVGVTELILIQNLCLFTDTRVPVGTTGLMLTLSIQEYPLVLLNLFKYKSTRRYYKTKSETRVPVGTTEKIRYRSTPRYYRP